MKRILACLILMLTAFAAPVWADMLPKPAMLLTAAYSRAGQDLSGQWHYSVDPYKTGTENNRRSQRYLDIDVAANEAKNPHDFYEFDMGNAPQTTLPGAWNSADPILRYYDGLMWYQRHFTTQPSADKRAFLRFEAVNYATKVYLNGMLVGSHTGGFTPFVIEVTKVIRAGDNQITLAVDSEHSATTVPPTVTDWDIYGGVTRAIRLIYTPKTFIDDQVVSLGEDGLIHAQVALNGPDSAGRFVNVNIKDLGLKVSAKTDATGTASFALKPKGLKLWSPDTPTLYDIGFTSGDDALSDRVGFRTIKVSGDKILLNGKPIFLRGISMHEEELGENPARIMTPDAVRALLTQIKDGLHGNFVRLAHYPHTEITTRIADELGLLVWSEIPVYWSVDFTNPDTLKTARNMQLENILRDRNRASVIIWSVGNETPINEPRNQFLGTLADDAHALDPTRLVSAALNLGRTEVDGHLDLNINDPLVARLDIMAINTYTGWYGDDTLADVPGTTWHSQYNKPLILTEFGAGALTGFHDPEHTAKFSEEYQADYYRATLAMAAKIPFLSGMSPWLLKDFRSPRRQHPVYQQGWNRKGLLSPTGERKLAFKVLADDYAARAK